jgi:hypothetical protein
MAATPYPAWDGFAPRLALPDGGCALSGMGRIAPRLGRCRMADTPYPAYNGVASRLGRCRMAATPYPAYDRFAPRLGVALHSICRPDKRSAIRHKKSYFPPARSIKLPVT